MASSNFFHSSICHHELIMKSISFGAVYIYCIIHTKKKIIFHSSALLMWHSFGMIAFLFSFFFLMHDFGKHDFKLNSTFIEWTGKCVLKAIIRNNSVSLFHLLGIIIKYNLVSCQHMRKHLLEDKKTFCWLNNHEK